MVDNTTCYGSNGWKSRVCYCDLLKIKTYEYDLRFKRYRNRRQAVGRKRRAAATVNEQFRGRYHGLLRTRKAPQTSHNTLGYNGFDFIVFCNNIF